MNFDLGPAGIVGGGVNDLLQVSGSVVLGGNLNVADAGGFGAGSYRLINYGGTLTDNGLTFGTLPAGFDPANFAVQTSIAGQVNLILDETSVLFWDGSQTVANGAFDGGTGTWDNATTNWTNSSGSAQRAWNGRTAIFTGAAGTVTLGGNVSTRGMQFTTTGYVVNAAAAQTITLDGAVPLRAGVGVSARIDAPLVGAGSLLKQDPGTITLGGANTYTGGTSISAGSLLVNGSLANGAVFVSTSATLGGIGAIGGEVTVANGGKLTPGWAAPAPFRSARSF